MKNRDARPRGFVEHRKPGQSGFTLLEAIVVIVLTGIIAGMVAVFIRAPVEGYVDSVRRAELTDAADTALRRIARDLRRALPNSVRIDPTGKGLELLLARSGGRYRAQCQDNSVGDPLIFGSADDYPCEPADNKTFDVLGGPVEVAAGDWVVVYNLGIPGASAYDDPPTNRRAVNGATGLLAVIGYSGDAFPLASPANRFHVISGPVQYVCASGALRRLSGYAISTVQSTTPANPASAVLVGNVDCDKTAFAYDPSAIGRTGLATLRLTLTTGAGESVTLFHAVHVSNVP